MSDICPNCGLPQDLCVCETIAKENQKIVVSSEKRKFGKIYTIIRGFGKGIDLDDLAKKLKTKFACGGTAKENQIELQGDHKQRAKHVLTELGFPEETIETK
jgi:translation initiation factor 1